MGSGSSSQSVEEGRLPPVSPQSRFRRKRIRLFVHLVRRIVEKEGRSEIRIADIGGSRAYWDIFPFAEFRDLRFHFSLVNTDARALSDESGIENATFTSEVGDACRLDGIADGEFDIGHANSVIEHVGPWGRMKDMADELRRISRYQYVQTPNFWFPIEPHVKLPLVHWLPRPLAVRILARMKGHMDFEGATTWYDATRLLDKREMRTLFPEAELIVERFALYPKSFITRSRV